MRELHPADVAGIAALLVIGLLVALYGGLLEEEIAALNENSGAVMALAATVTAAATLALAWLNRSTWKLYQLERERDSANQLRIAERCKRAASRSQYVEQNWEELSETDWSDLRTEGERPVLTFRVQLDRTRELLADLDQSLSRWVRECRDPEAVKSLIRAHRAVRSAKGSLPDESEDPAEQGRERWSQWIYADVSFLHAILEHAANDLER